MYHHLHKRSNSSRTPHLLSTSKVGILHQTKFQGAFSTYRMLYLIEEKSPSQIPCLSAWCMLLNHQYHPCGGLLENVGIKPHIVKSFRANIRVCLVYIFVTSYGWNMFSSMRAFQRILKYSK